MTVKKWKIIGAFYVFSIFFISSHILVQYASLFYFILSFFYICQERLQKYRSFQLILTKILKNLFLHLFFIYGLLNSTDLKLPNAKHCFFCCNIINNYTSSDGNTYGTIIQRIGNCMSILKFFDFLHFGGYSITSWVLMGSAT